jgi:dihydroorotate dehydrogenase
MVGTANITDPFAGPRILRELEKFMDEDGASGVDELIGSLETDPN